MKIVLADKRKCNKVLFYFIDIPVIKIKYSQKFI